MKQYPIVFTLIIFLCQHFSFGQEMDSIPFEKVSMVKGEYELQNTSIRSIVLTSKKPVPFDKNELKSEGRAASSVWTLLTGMPTGSINESAWILNNQVQIQDEQFYLPVMVNGAFHRDRERVKDEEGNRTIETTETVELYWKEGAWGWIIQENDTLGKFQLEIRTSQSDPEKRWQTYTDVNINWLRSKLKKHGIYENPYDFLIKGSINGQDFILLYSGRFFREALISEDKLVGLWQDKPYVVMLSKKHRIYPYVLLPKEASLEKQKQKLLLLGLGQTMARNLM
ncbi:MAG: hypothetical protein RLP12_13995, partial [Ekhidna sp.]